MTNGFVGRALRSSVFSDEATGAVALQNVLSNLIANDNGFSNYCQIQSERQIGLPKEAWRIPGNAAGLPSPNSKPSSAKCWRSWVEFMGKLDKAVGYAAYRVYELEELKLN